MPAGGIAASAPAGLFGPGSLVWQVDRELAVLGGSGARALLLQVAHPKVAAAVVEHSRYATDPLGRLRHTLEAIYAFAFADEATALRWVRDVNGRHVSVRGRLAASVGRHPAGSPYLALDPTLLLWVYATLIDSSLVAYERYVAPLADAERERYYAEMARHGPLWGIPPAILPESLAALRAWMEDLVERGEVAVGMDGRTVARRILRSPAWWMPDLLFAPVALNAVWLLPPTLRAQFGFSWGPRREALMRGLARGSRLVVPRLPRALRDVPWARAAERRPRADGRPV